MTHARNWRLVTLGSASLAAPRGYDELVAGIEVLDDVTLLENLVEFSLCCHACQSASLFYIMHVWIYRMEPGLVAVRHVRGLTFRDFHGVEADGVEGSDACIEPPWRTW